MSLGEILNDLNKDTPNIVPSFENANLENIVITDIKKNGELVNIHHFSKETLERVNNMFNLITLKQNVSSMPRVERSVVMEIFTMIPDVGKVEEAKLTAAPSLINKEIMDRIFTSSIKNKISADVIDKLDNIKGLIETHIPMIDTLVNYFKTFNSTVEGKVEIFKKVPPMVVNFKKYSREGEDNGDRNVNLFTEKFDVITDLDDTKLEYPKYANKLVRMYTDIYRNETLKTLQKCQVYVPKMVEVSLASVVQSGVSLISTLSDNYRTELEQYLTGLSSMRLHDAELNLETIKFINGYEYIAVILETIGRLKSIIETKDNCFDKTAELIEFID